MGCMQQTLTRFPFDAQYVRQLRERAHPVEEHFSSYFHRILTNYLRGRIKSPELLEDIRQETLLRVLHSLRAGDGLRRPECLASFVMAVCQNVLREQVRAQVRYTGFDEPAVHADRSADPEKQAIAGQRRASLTEALAQLATRERQVLAMTLADAQPADISRRLGLTQGNVRVVLHRAKAHLRDYLLRDAVIN
jgi:RNA polymerase sigma-70 factor, ECF subfamily